MTGIMDHHAGFLHVSPQLHMLRQAIQARGYTELVPNRIFRKDKDHPQPPSSLEKVACCRRFGWAAYPPAQGVALAGCRVGMHKSDMRLAGTSGLVLQVRFEEPQILVDLAGDLREQIRAVRVAQFIGLVDRAICTALPNTDSWVDR